jgi:hypothetical protein
MYSVNDTSTSDLLRNFGAILRELHRRGVVRSYNNPVGDIAEWLSAKAFGLTLETNSAKGHDAVDAHGKRYQIKSRRITAKNPSTQLGVMRDLAAKHFDYLLAIYFNEDFEISSAYLVEHGTVVKHALFSKAQGGHILHAKGALIADPGCRNVTKECQAVPFGDGHEDVL